MDGSAPYTPPSSLLLRSLARERGFEPMRIEGTIPEGLAGTLYRVGPGLLDSVGVPVTHLFEADGALTAVRVGPNHAEGGVRIVESAGLRDERLAGRPLSGLRAPYLQRLRASFERRFKNVANTAPMIWQDRLFAMVEAAKPTEMDADTLATIGETDLGGVVPFAFSAHPHRVDARKAQYNFGVRYGRHTKLDVFELPDVGAARRITSIPLRRAVMMHDFVATDRRLVFFVSPFEVNVPRAVLQLAPFGKMFEYHPEHGSEIIVVPLDDPSNVRRFTVDSFFQWHFANAFESNDGFEVDFVRYSNADSFHEIGKDTPIGGELVRVRIDDGSTAVTTVNRVAGMYEFPTIDPRVAGRRHRFVFTNRESTDTRGIARHDLVSGHTDSFTEPASSWYGEPVFAPDPRGHEGDGWLLTTVLDARAARTYVAVFDARRVADGPVAKLWFPDALPISFHGVWKPT